MEQSSQPSPQPSPDRVGTRIYDALVDFGTDPELLRHDATLEELDIDSLDLFELGQILNHEFGIEVDPQDFEGVTTVGQAQEAMLGYLK